MTQRIMFKKGDLVLYDKFGTATNTISPSLYLNDFGVGLIVKIFEESPGGEDNSYAKVMKDDGNFGFFSLSYLNPIDHDGCELRDCSSTVSPQMI
jgi:hypothetical protein